MSNSFGALIDTRKLGVVVMLAFALLAFAPPARSQVVQPVVNLEPVTVVGNLATVKGTLGGAPLATLALTINGQPVSVNAQGQFTAVLDLAGVSVITLVVTNPLTGSELLRLGIPVSLAGPGEAIPDLLAVLERAGVSLTIPPEALRVLDGLPVTITGHVLNRDQLAGMTINGIDVLRLLMPDGSFTLPLPGSTKEVRLEVTDLQGISQVRIVEVVHYVTVPGPLTSAPAPTVRCTIVGTAGADRLLGTPGDDVICALGGDDYVAAGAGRDTVSGGSGRDSLFGQAGPDHILGGTHADRLVGGGGNDRLSGGRGADRILGGRNSDQLVGGAGRDLLFGGTHADRLMGGAGNDRLVGGAGNDRLSGGRGADRMSGSAGRDSFHARDRTRDIVLGGTGIDRARTDRIDRRRSIERSF